MDNPKGFGLVQRDRDFRSYQDLETHAERRPSVWIVPRNDWGAGRVELVEIPTNSDTNDNVVGFWVPEKPPKPGGRRRSPTPCTGTATTRSGRRAAVSSRPAATRGP